MDELECVFPGCSGPEGLLYEFPANQVVRSLWLEACDLQNRNIITDSARVCASHFTDRDFKVTQAGSKLALLPEAVPNASTTDVISTSHYIMDTSSNSLAALVKGEDSDSSTSDDASETIKPFWRDSAGGGPPVNIVINKSEGSDGVAYAPAPKKQKLAKGKRFGVSKSVLESRAIKAVRIKELQNHHKDEVSNLRAEIHRLKSIIAKHEALQTKWMSHSKRWEKKMEKARHVTSKEGRLKVVSDLLREHKFTQNQVDLITHKVKRVKEWTKEEMAEAFYQWNMGKELYEYQHKHFFQRCPMPSVACLINFRDQNPETFECKHELCKKIFFSEETLATHMESHGGSLLCEQCGKGFPNKYRLHSHVRAVHFKFKQWRCRLCSREFEKQENLEIHLAVFHLRLCANDKGYKAKRADYKAVIAEYKEKIPFKLIDSQTGVIGEPDFHGNQDAIRLEEVTTFKIEEVVEAIVEG